MISSEVYKKEHVYVGIGDYEVSFAYDISANIIVEWINSLGVLSGAKTEGVDYEVVTVSSVAYIRVLIDFGANGVLTIRRDLPLTQTFNFVDGGDPPPSSIMRAIDRVVWMCQQIFGAVSGSLRTPAHESLDMTIPTIIVRAMGFQGYDAAGLPVIYAGIPSVPVSSYVAPGLALTDQQSFLNYYGMGNFQKSDFTSTVAGWVTLLRTQKNFAGIVKISAYANNLKDFITFSVYGHEDTGDHDITILEQSRKGSIEGITKVRWGDAGAGNGLCLQLYVDPDTDPSIVVRATTYAAGPIDSSTGVGFQLGPHINTTTDYDDNTVTVFRTYYRAALPELIRSNPYRMAHYPDIVVNGTTVTRVEPGIYNSITFTAAGNMGCGKYIVLGDFADGGNTITIDNEPAPSGPSSAIGSSAVATSRCWHGNTPMGETANVEGRYGGGNGGYIVNQISGGSGPCGGGGSHQNYNIHGGGWIIVNCLGKITLTGTFNANAIAAITVGCGAAGGAILFRQLEEGGLAGTLNANGSARASLEADGGGGRVETYCFGAFTGSTSVVKGGINGAPTDGKAYHINLINQPEMVLAGGSDIVTADEYLHAGKIIKADGGWWL